MAAQHREEIRTKKIGFVGGGNMCKAIVSGLMANKLFSPNQILIYGPHPEKLDSLKQQGNIISPSIKDLITKADIIFISVKPIMLEQVMCSISAVVNEDTQNKYLISILAGTLLDKLKSYVSPSWNWRIIRVMPNTPMMVGQGCVIYSLVDNTKEEYETQLIETLMGNCSGVVRKIPEYLINACSAICGSGPAYGYLMIEALADGGVKMGVPRDLAMQLAAQTLIGASKMVLETGKHPGLLKDEVCSAGGTTICGVHELEKGGVRNSLVNAVEAATLRGREMESLK